MQVFGFDSMGGDGAVLFIDIGSDAQAVGKPGGQRGDVVIRHEPALPGRDHQINGVIASDKLEKGGRGSARAMLSPAMSPS
jgi:hypothetical protein